MEEPKPKGNIVGLLIVVVITVVALVVGNWFVGGDDEAGATSDVQVSGAAKAPKVGESAPSFVAQALDGEVRLEDVDKPTWLLFMASWCQQCRVEAPDVQQAHLDRDDVDIVAVYIGEDEAKVREYSQRLGLTFAQIPNPNQDIAAAYGVGAIPVHYFIDADGVVREVAFGALSASVIDEKLDALVG